MHTGGDQTPHGPGPGLGSRSEPGPPGVNLRHWPLNAISLVFKTISFLNLKLKALNRRHYPNAVIISIDNLSFGGTGKTPLVIETGRQLEQAGITFAIVTRGYRSRLEHPGGKVDISHDYHDVGDEAVLFKSRFPHRDIYVGKNRKRSIETAIRDNNRVILLDDGFQTTGVAKDLTIMLLNPRHPYYYLRNFRFMAKQEDLVLVYQGNNGAEVENGYYFQLDGFFDTGSRPALLDTQTPVLGFSALGDNQRFREDLSSFKLLHFAAFNDHHAYTMEDIEALNRQRLKLGADHLVCTEKDFIKIKTLNLDQIPLIYAKNSIKSMIDPMLLILSKIKSKGLSKSTGID